MNTYQRIFALALGCLCAAPLWSATPGAPVAQMTTATPDTAATEIFVTPRNATVPYRIPAIATTRSGHLIAVADYRYSGGDIGTGKLDLQGRISTDNGRTWGPIFTIVRGDDYPDTSQLMCVGFGDPAIVADRTSNRVLLISCAGNVLFQRATRQKHQAIARFYSEDGGQTWSKPTDISERIYSMFDHSAAGAPKSMFVGSGRIFQSRTVKKGRYYRLYFSVLYKDERGTYKNYVLYSDDFGGEWNVLGGIHVPPIPQKADEPKVEELPDGSVLCSSRVTGGRYYNIYTFSDKHKVSGSWGRMAFSGKNNNGVAAEGNSCNGEVMILPARRKSDGKKLYVALQSVPFGPGRTNVGLYYKELAGPEDYDTPEHFAANWDGRYAVSHIGSGYSTMTLQKDRSIGFLYEESTHGRDYTILYKRLSLEDITAGRYEARKP